MDEESAGSGAGEDARPVASTTDDGPAPPTRPARADEDATARVRYYARLLWFHLRLGLAEHRPHFVAATALFVVALLGGVALALAEVNLLELLGFENLEEVFEGAELTVEFIFLNNSRVLLLLVAGLLTLGLLTLLLLGFNGLLIGWVVGVAAGEIGVGLLLALLVPHGVLELPAFWLGAAVAFRVVHVVVNYLRDVRDHLFTRAELGRVLLVVLLAWAMVGAAAVIEVHVTPAVAEAIYGSAESGTV